MSLPRVAAVVVEYRTPDLTRACVRALAASRGVECIPVIADQSPAAESGLARLAAEQGGTYVALPENLGFAGGANRGIATALPLAPRAMAVLNPDVRVAPDCLAELVAALDRHPGVGLVGPGLLQEGAPAPTWWNAGSEIDWPSGRPRSRLHGEPWTLPAEGLIDCDFVCGSLLVFRPEFLASVGYLSGEYFLYFEDADLAYRTRRTGLRTCVVPRASAWHLGGGSSAGLEAECAYYRARNRLLFSRAWNPRPVLGRLYRTVFALRLLARSLVRFAGGHGPAAWLPARAVLDHARGRYGKILPRPAGSGHGKTPRQVVRGRPA
jgi:GT2 family glycosyltransferase